MKKRKHYKIPRGAFEEQQLREERHNQNLRALMIILPVVMAAVLIVGVFFGYKNFLKESVSYSGATRSEAYFATENPEEDKLLSVISSASPVDESYTPALVSVEGVSVSPLMQQSLRKMLHAAEQDGADLILKEGYISFEEQRKRFEKAIAEYKKSAKASTVKAESYVRRTTPKAGESEQQTGLLLYFTTGGKEKFESTSAFRWLIKNAPSYGFILRYPEKENAGGMGYSSHLFRYVGEENAYFMRAYNMNFDEYVAYCAYK